MLIHVQSKDKQPTSYFIFLNATLLGLKPFRHFHFIIHHSTSHFFFPEILLFHVKCHPKNQELFLPGEKQLVF